MKKKQMLITLSEDILVWLAIETERTEESASTIIRQALRQVMGGVQTAPQQPPKPTKEPKPAKLDNGKMEV